MRDIPSSLISPPPPPPPTHPPLKSNMSMLYYGMVVVGTAAVVLALYNLIIIKWCTHRQSQSRLQGGPNNTNRLIEVTTTSQSFENPHRNLLTSFKYKKGNSSNIGAQDEGSEYECAVCLSCFEEGEEVRQLPQCKHSFHAPCIDMWLYSHYDCPLCRAPVAVLDIPRCHRHRVSVSENSREGLLNSGMSV